MNIVGVFHNKENRVPLFFIIKKLKEGPGTVAHTHVIPAFRMAEAGGSQPSLDNVAT